MSILNEFLIFEQENEHDFAYDLSMKKNYSNPKLYTASGDLSKRWYVYFSYRNPKTGSLKRVTPFYGEAHKYKTKEDRLFVLATYRKKILELLKQGYNPFEDNTAFYKSQQKKTDFKNVETITRQVVEEKIAITGKTIIEAFDFALMIKKKVVSPATYNVYASKSKGLQQFLEKNYPAVKYVEALTKKMVVEFLNEVLQRTSARSRNNYRIDLGSLFQMLEDNEIIATNFIKRIPVLKAIPHRNKTYTNQTQEAIFKFLETEDPVLLLYIKFISYNFLRPIEVNRLRVGDINLKEKTISFKAKNSPLKTKIIPAILVEDLPDLSALNKENPLFTPTKFGDVWNAEEMSRRDYFFSFKNIDV